MPPLLTLILGPRTSSGVESYSDPETAKASEPQKDTATANKSAQTAFLSNLSSPLLVHPPRRITPHIATY
jgi:hypothetical protein